MDSTVSSASNDTADSIGCELIAELVKERGSYKDAARPIDGCPESFRNYATGRRKPGFALMFEMMVYDDFLFEEFLRKRESRRAECQTK